jgi:hypothetical protein
VRFEFLNLTAPIVHGGDPEWKTQEIRRTQTYQIENPPKKYIFASCLPAIDFATDNLCNVRKGYSVEWKDKKMNQANEVYVCPMHADVKSDKPGKCPKCGMYLELKK